LITLHVPYFLSTLSILHWFYSNHFSIHVYFLISACVPDNVEDNDSMSDKTIFTPMLLAMTDNQEFIGNTVLLGYKLTALLGYRRSY